MLQKGDLGIIKLSGFYTVGRVNYTYFSLYQTVAEVRPRRLKIAINVIFIHYSKFDTNSFSRSMTCLVLNSLKLLFNIFQGLMLRDINAYACIRKHITGAFSFESLG
jgi:hypothetical protein